MTRIVRPVVLLLSMILITSLAYADLEKTLVKRMPLGKKPLDIAQSVQDGRIFILLEGGEVQIFSPEGQQQERFKVSPGSTSLEVFPDGRKLYLGNEQNNELEILDLSIITELPVGNSAIRGPENAPVTITLFSDFQCPYCAKLEPILDQVLAAYPTQVRLVFKQFPLNMHKFARKASTATIAARNQGKFWPLHDQLFANYNKLSDALIRELAEKVGLDMKKFDADIANPAVQQEINLDIQLGTQAGVRGTPAVYINGKQLKDRSIQGFKREIDGELKN